MIGITQIGSLESRRISVDRNQGKLPTFKKMGREWSERINILTDVILSKKMLMIDKFPAYGALFYLFMVFDLIPDTVPVFGLMDDFSILGIAAAYYIKRKIEK